MFLLRLGLLGLVLLLPLLKIVFVLVVGFLDFLLELVLFSRGHLAPLLSDDVFLVLVSFSDLLVAFVAEVQVAVEWFLGPGLSLLFAAHAPALSC